LESLALIGLSGSRSKREGWISEDIEESGIIHNCL
jgi:hypothetical protein